MELLGVGIEDGTPIAVFQGEDKCAMIVERCVGIHNEQPVIVKTYSRVLIAGEHGELVFEAQLN